MVKCGAGYSYNTDKPTIWYPTSPCICCLGWGLFFFFWRWREKFRYNWIICMNQQETQGLSNWNTAEKQADLLQFPVEKRTVPSAPLWTAVLRSVQHLFPHRLPHISRQYMQTKSFPEYMVFRCHQGPHDLSLSLPSVLPPVFEEQVPYSCPTSKTTMLPLAVYWINKIAAP